MVSFFIFCATFGKNGTGVLFNKLRNFLWMLLISSKKIYNSFSPEDAQDLIRSSSCSPSPSDAATLDTECVTPPFWSSFDA
jgi:hypothetical protein